MQSLQQEGNESKSDDNTENTFIGIEIGRKLQKAIFQLKDKPLNIQDPQIQIELEQFGLSPFNKDKFTKLTVDQLSYLSIWILLHKELRVFLNNNKSFTINDEKKNRIINAFFDDSKTDYHLKDNTIYELFTTEHISSLLKGAKYFKLDKRFYYNFPINKLSNTTHRHMLYTIFKHISSEKIMSLIEGSKYFNTLPDIQRVLALNILIKIYAKFQFKRIKNSLNNEIESNITFRECLLEYKEILTDDILNKHEDIENLLTRLDAICDFQSLYQTHLYYFYNPYYNSSSKIRYDSRKNIDDIFHIAAINYTILHATSKEEFNIEDLAIEFGIPLYEVCRVIKHIKSTPDNRLITFLPSEKANEVYEKIKEKIKDIPLIIKPTQVRIMQYIQQDEMNRYLDDMMNQGSCPIKGQDDLVFPNNDYNNLKDNIDKFFQNHYKIYAKNAQATWEKSLPGVEFLAYDKAADKILEATRNYKKYKYNSISCDPNFNSKNQQNEDYVELYKKLHSYVDMVFKRISKYCSTDVRVNLQKRSHAQMSGQHQR